MHPFAWHTRVGNMFWLKEVGNRRFGIGTLAARFDFDANLVGPFGARAILVAQ